MNIKDKKIMIVVAHPDDELLGLGATMHRFIHEYNVKTHVVILGEGITSRAEQRNPKLWEKELVGHKNNIANAQEKIGYHSVSTHNFADNRFDSHDLLDIVKVVEKEKKSFLPDIIFTHHGGDLNIDHRITFQAVITATRPMKEEITTTIITFETPSGSEWQAPSDPYRFTPNLYVSVSKNDIEAKCQGMECYEFEKREYPHPRSPQALEILAQSRGIQIGRQYAEAFQIIRDIL